MGRRYARWCHHLPWTCYPRDLFPTFVHFGATPFSRNIARARDVASVCQTYAKEHGGKFPSSLTAIVPPIEETIGGRWQYFDYASGRPYDWLYFPGATTADGEKRVVVASTTAATKGSAATSERIVAFADGHAEWWPESSFKRSYAGSQSSRSRPLIVCRD
jgi:hypothetical protein